MEADLRIDGRGRRHNLPRKDVASACAELRYLPLAQVLVAGGLGVQLLGKPSDPEFGIGADIRAAYLPLQFDGQRLGLVAEFIPGFVDESYTYSAGGGLLWLVP